MRSVKEFLGALIRSVTQLLFPHFCIGCGKNPVQKTNSPLCPQCMEAIKAACAVCCPMCQTPIARCRCMSFCDAKVPLYSMYPYRAASRRSDDDSVVRDPVANMLLSRKTRLIDAAEAFLAAQTAALCACVIAEQSEGDERDDWILTYPPRSEKKRREVGHDHSAEMAKRVSVMTGVPMLACLDRVRGADTAQKTLGAVQREENAKESYVLSQRYADEIRGKRVILIDDIATTGATLSVCASLLLEAGAASVTAVTAARTVQKEHP